MARVHLEVFQHRNASRGRPRAEYLGPRPHSETLKEQKRSALLQFKALPYERPQTRADCVDAPRPCPFVGCRFNLYLEVNERNGSIKFRFPDREPEDMPVSCALDVADEGGATYDQIGLLMNITKQGVELAEHTALAKLAKITARDRKLREYRNSTPLSDLGSHALTELENES